jgi:hypothetical protein
MKSIIFTMLFLFLFSLNSFAVVGKYQICMGKETELYMVNTETGRLYKYHTLYGAWQDACRGIER